MTTEAIIKEVRVAAKKWGEVLEPGATESEIDDFVKKVERQYDAVLPEAYIDMLRIVNGLEFNGLIVYGTKDSISDLNSSPLDFFVANDSFRETRNRDAEKLLLLGETSTGLLVYDTDCKQFQYRDRIGIDRVEPYSCFEAMLETEVKKAL